MLNIDESILQESTAAQERTFQRIDTAVFDAD